MQCKVQLEFSNINQQSSSNNRYNQASALISYRSKESRGKHVLKEERIANKPKK